MIIRTKSLKDFIERAKIRHINKYDYSKTVYSKTHEKVTIICPEHGEFKQTPHNHLAGQGCPKCGILSTRNSHKKYNTANIIEKFIEIHGEIYDYSKFIYNGFNTKSIIICKTHGEFYQTPSSHLRGLGCAKCGHEKTASSKRSSILEFISKANIIHNKKYDYSKVNYINSKTKVTITCPIHGEFLQSPSIHLSGSGCPKCSGKLKYTKDEWIEKANKKHNFKYDYSNVEYINNKTKVNVICPIHGPFFQTPNDHLDGCGCPKCKIDNQRFSIEKILELMKATHGSKYDYSKSDIKTTADKIKIICPEHGEFWQTPGNHIYLSHGCPRCRLKNQNHIFEFFRKNLPNKTILWEYSPDWLYPQRIDIFIKELSVAIEYNGEQHYTPIDIFGGIETFNKQKELDVRKYNKCVENRCKVFYIKYNYTDQTLNDILNELR